jgi:hypothetical protein
MVATIVPAISWIDMMEMNSAKQYLIGEPSPTPRAPPKYHMMQGKAREGRTMQEH